MVNFLFGYFTEIFSFFLSFALIFALVYGILSKSKVVSEGAGVNSAIAFAIAMIFAFSGAWIYIVEIVPYFAVLLIMFASFFLILLFLGYKMENLMKSKVVIWVILIVSIVFVLFSGWNLYYKDIQEQLQLYTLENTTIDDPELLANMTGNPFHDVPLRYEYHCMRQGRYLAPILFFGEGGVLCLVMHPKVIGIFILLPLLALITYLIAHYSGGKPET